MQHRGFRWLEAMVVALVVTVGGCFAFELFIAKPDLAGVALGFLPSWSIVTDQEQL